VFEADLTLKAFAKINWTLHVLGRRSDGYHEIRTIFQTVTLHDTLSFGLLKGGPIRLTCDRADIPVDEGNLVYRAALALQKRYGIKDGVRVHLEKRIPAAGGLGGGSSDAAVTLLGLAHLWRIEASPAELHEIGASLGADVPFFLVGGTARAVGLGTEITPLDEVVAEHLLIVAPGVGVSTAEAYKALNARALTKAGGEIMLSSSRADARILNSLHDALHNDFERVVFRLKPEIERAHGALLTKGARAALLAGSGSSVFGIFDNREALTEAAQALRFETGWGVFTCATLARAEYREALGLCAAPIERAFPEVRV
jgi:4-diphosphocytidyl-2-C-methyl-D-erythritol kinase